MQMKTIVASTALVSAMFLLTGCGAKGQQFTGFATPKDNQGLVYVYRPSSIVGAGVYYKIHVENETTPDFIAGELVNGAFLEIDVPEGESEIWGKTEAKSSVVLDIKEGDIQCVRGGLGIGLFVGRPHLEKVDMETCETEILDTKRP